MSNTVNSKKEEPIPQVDLKQIFLYTFIILFIWVIPLTIIAFLSILYFRYIIKPDLETYSSPLLFIQSIGEGDLYYLFISMITPLVVIFLYIFELFLVAVFTKIFIAYCNHLSPMRELIGAKGNSGQEKLDVDIYHLRGAIYRIMKWIYSRAPFPWMIKWAFSFVSNNKYGKGTVLEDQYYCHEYFETGKNVYIDKLAIASSHLVDGGYGALTLKQVTIEDNAVIGANVGICPGVLMETNSEVLFNSMVPKYKKLKSNEKYYGIPVVKLQNQSIDHLISNNHKKNDSNLEKQQEKE